MRIFLLAISFPPCSYSSTTCLAFALHDGPWAVVRLADMVHNSSLTGQWAICYFIPFADICHIIFHFLKKSNPFFKTFFIFFEVFRFFLFFPSPLKNPSAVCFFQPFVFPVFHLHSIHCSRRIIHMFNIHASVRIIPLLKDPFTNFRPSPWSVFVKFVQSHLSSLYRLTWFRFIPIFALAL